jgi:hypothetical protein
MRSKPLESCFSVLYDCSMKTLVFLIILTACANLTPPGSKVGFIETNGSGYEVMEYADRIAAEHSCDFIGYVDAKSSVFPGSYSVHENEVHSALRNRAAKMGVNVVVANFYEKPARGVGLLCPESFVSSNQ